jgi:hypothetical protein
MEDILNEAIMQLRKGAPKQELLSKYPEAKTELEPLLEVAEIFWQLPKNQPPQPAMQRKYALVPAAAKLAWFAWLKVSRLATISMAVLLLTAAVVGTGFATSRSVAGDRLFALKKTTEQFRLKFATSEAAKASLQVAFVNNRLNEAEFILNNPNSDSDTRQAALNELMSETQNTINVVSAAAKDNSLKQNGTPIVDSLAAITKKQQALLNKIKPDSKNPLAAKSALETAKENVSKVAEIQNYIQAASNEQVMANLDASPNSVIISGSITQLSKDNVTVEKTSFTISDSTVIKNAANDPADINTLRVNDKIKLLGHKTDKQLFADQIYLIAPDTQNPPAPDTNLEQKDQSATDKTPNDSSTPQSILTVPDKDNLGAGIEAVAPANPNTASGGSIPEDPAPQMPAQ